MRHGAILMGGLAMTNSNTKGSDTIGSGLKNNTNAKKGGRRKKIAKVVWNFEIKKPNKYPCSYEQMAEIIIAQYTNKEHVGELLQKAFPSMNIPEKPGQIVSGFLKRMESAMVAGEPEALAAAKKYDLGQVQNEDATDDQEDD